MYYAACLAKHGMSLYLLSHVLFSIVYQVTRKEKAPAQPRHLHFESHYSAVSCTMQVMRLHYWLELSPPHRWGMMDAATVDNRWHHEIYTIILSDHQCIGHAWR
jgi:hypothetical protein